MKFHPSLVSGCAILALTTRLAAQPADHPQPVASLIQRLLPSKAAAFTCETIAADNGKDVFEIESRDGQIILRGNSPLSQAVAFNHYLKHHLHGHVSLNGCQITPPAVLPALASMERHTAWASTRYCFNYCAFGYSIPWWHWERWEQLIDWMALQGINQPLAITGQEAVWQAVCRRFGMKDSEIASFLAGPPYLPFQWMGCLDSHGGPLPARWIEKRADLQRKILARQRELGMTPVLQGFTGHVPQAIVKRFPDMRAQRIHWVDGFQTWVVDPLDPMFQKLGDAFIEEQQKRFGTDHIYATDPFIEMEPPKGDSDYLAAMGRAIYQGMAAKDPKAVWVLQSWPFHYKRSFWKPERVEAFLNSVPDDRMLVLDLYCDLIPLWSRTRSFHGKPWVWNFLYNFGDNTLLGCVGKLDRFHDLAAVRANPQAANLRGIGMTMEGFSENPPIYDIMFELAWADRVDLPSWFRDYATFRYGAPNKNTAAAWDLLLKDRYSRDLLRPPRNRIAITGYPTTAQADVHTDTSTQSLVKAWRLMLQATPEFGQTETYRFDLVNIGRQALSGHAATLVAATKVAWDNKDPAAHRQAVANYVEFVRETDELLASHPSFMLGRWIADARRWGETDAEKDRLEWNARRVVSLWGTGTRLRDYAWKEWSGMLTGFYARRWEILFRHQREALEGGRAFDPKACDQEILRFENDWASGREDYPDQPVGDTMEISRRLMRKYFPE